MAVEIEIAHAYRDGDTDTAEVEPAADLGFLPPGVQVHPAFADEDADILLCSRDNVLFRVHSLVLRLASGWFRTLFTLPQSPLPAPPLCKRPPPELIPMVEPADVLAALLGTACGHALPPLDSLPFVEALLHAADKFDMPAALSVLRLALTAPPLLDAHPVRVYGLACQWGWREEARAAAARTVGVDLCSRDAVRDMGAVDAPYLARLMLLHRRRREALKAALDAPGEFYANCAPGKCSQCQKEIVHAGWLQLKYAWVAAMETCPAEVASGRILQRPEVHEVLGATCQHCERKLYNPEVTMVKLKAILDRLPTSVDLD
ncbi:hypothetical protein EIP86_002948 [Pleurotus ostreatoroseus]|nr:hypothetical protein EIP86_002948 [Pleurotus ostreatoroseus]